MAECHSEAGEAAAAEMTRLKVNLRLCEQYQN